LVDPLGNLLSSVQEVFQIELTRHTIITY